MDRVTIISESKCFLILLLLYNSVIKCKFLMGSECGNAFFVERINNSTIDVYNNAKNTSRPTTFWEQLKIGQVSTN